MQIWFIIRLKNDNSKLWRVIKPYRENIRPPKTPDPLNSSDPKNENIRPPQKRISDPKYENIRPPKKKTSDSPKEYQTIKRKHQTLKMRISEHKYQNIRPPKRKNLSPNKKNIRPQIRENQKIKKKKKDQALQRDHYTLKWTSDTKRKSDYWKKSSDPVNKADPKYENNQKCLNTRISDHQKEIRNQNPPKTRMTLNMRTSDCKQRPNPKNNLKRSTDPPKKRRIRPKSARRPEKDHIRL